MQITKKMEPFIIEAIERSLDTHYPKSKRGDAFREDLKRANLANIKRANGNILSDALCIAADGHWQPAPDARSGE